MSAFIESVWNVLLELSPWLLLGMAVAGVLHAVLPKDFVRRHMQGKGGVLKGVALGVPLPLCSCGVLPAALGLKKDGASNGATAAFLISTPQTGVDSILVSSAFLGWPFAVFKVAAAAVTGLAGGWLTDAFAPDDGSAEGGATPETGERSVRGALNHSLELLRMIWGWLLFGVLVSALITVVVPDDFFRSSLLSNPFIASFAVLLVSLPMYVCATASVPIAAALVAAGMPTGAALVFLMAGPATNIATAGAIKRGLGTRVLVIYLATVALGSIGLSMLFEWVLPSAGAISHAGHHEHQTWWAIACAVLLLGLVSAFAFMDARLWLRKRKGAGMS
ncbi:MAG: permease, partial [Myxococcales bacterium]|nr:permease [Myxococcales bacterium]